jgi:hypothetical protein
MTTLIAGTIVPDGNSEAGDTLSHLEFIEGVNVPVPQNEGTLAESLERLFENRIEVADRLVVVNDEGLHSFGGGLHVIPNTA